MPTDSAMPGFHHTSSFDPERAMSQLDRDNRALGDMASAESRRIDGLVDDVGQIKGQISSVGSKVDGVVSGVDKLNTAMAGLVKFTLQVEHQHQAQEAQRAATAAHDLRLQALERRVEPIFEMKLGERVPTLEKQIGPLLELRTWVIGGGLTVIALLITAVAKLVLR